MILAPTGEDTQLPGSSVSPAPARVGLPNQWRLVLKDLERVVGLVGFIRWERERGCAEIGFGIANVFSGRGLMTEACRAVVQYGFDEMGLMRIEARCQPANVGSMRVLEKIGMIREATIRARVHAKAAEEDFWAYAIGRGGVPAADR